ncbi:hypothetical protein HY091_02510 [Candidatus Kaiserbacteria bacterium]|nr:hypothetical protein [Candidatus Kaiserbacteria bacterium]
MGNVRRKREGGYIALMATIVIGLVLLVMTAEEGFAGMHARFNVLGTERKEQATTLAEGCLNQGMAKLLVDPSAASRIDAVNGYDSGDQSRTYSYQIGALNNALNDASTAFSTSTVLFYPTGTVRDETGASTNANLQAIVDFSGVNLNFSSDKGVLVVQAVVGGNNDAKDQPEDFQIQVAGQGPVPLVQGIGVASSTDDTGVATSTFRGSAYGVAVYLPPNTDYHVYGVPKNGYLPHFVYANGQDNCTTARFTGADIGNYTIGHGIKVCTIRFEGPHQTTLTLAANVINQYKGKAAPADFTYLIDGAAAGLARTVKVADGPHTISIGLANAPNGKYSRPIVQKTGLPAVWRCFSGGTTTLVTMVGAGDVYNTQATVNAQSGTDTVCTLTLADPQVSAACADTAVMLAQNVSNGGGNNDIPNQKTAANQLLGLFNDNGKKSGIFPRVAIGSYGDPTGITTAGQATSTYGTQATETFTFGTPTPGTPVSVTVFAIAEGNGAGLQLVEEDGSAMQVGNAQTLTDTYAAYSYEFKTKPDSSTWSASDLTGGLFGNWQRYKFGVRSTSSGAPRVTQVYVQVNYQ